jgi:hypothetical protein
MRLITIVLILLCLSFPAFGNGIPKIEIPQIEKPLFYEDLLIDLPTPDYSVLVKLESKEEYQHDLEIVASGSRRVFDLPKAGTWNIVGAKAPATIYERRECRIKWFCPENVWGVPDYSYDDERKAFVCLSPVTKNICADNLYLKYGDWEILLGSREVE